MAGEAKNILPKQRLKGMESDFYNLSREEGNDGKKISFSRKLCVVVGARRSGWSGRRCKPSVGSISVYAVRRILLNPISPNIGNLSDRNVILRNKGGDSAN